MNRKLINVFLVAGMALTPSAAQALRSYEGADFSEDQNSLSEIIACDMERDDHGVHADYRKNFAATNYIVYDRGGAQNSCGRAYLGAASVTQHRIVEEVNLAPDYFGPWVFPA